jgi:hypothetical protein
MSKGALIFAYNSSLDYVSMATVAARLVKKYLDIPVTLVTNSTTVVDGVFENIILHELGESRFERVFNFGTSKERVIWHNQNRSSAYELSPYDQTLLIDADFLVFNSHLRYLFDTNLEIACYNRVTDITGSRLLQAHARVGTPGIPMQWATVVYFTKNKLAESVFEFMRTVRNNYMYYSTAYNFDAHLFRNDYALSIALQALTGYNTKKFTAIPGTLMTANPEIQLTEVRRSGELIFHWQVRDKSKTLMNRLHGTDIHIMNKRTITDPVILQQLIEYSL